MQIVLATGDHQHEVDVVVHDPDATVGDLATALAAAAGVPAVPGLELKADGEVVARDRRLDRSGLRSGTVVGLDPAEPRAISGPAASSGGRVEVAVVGGLDAGARTLLGPGRWSVGRRARDVAIGHDTVSGRHALLDVDPDGNVAVTDAGSHNGTWVDGQAVVAPTPLRPGAVVRLGAVQVAVRPPVADDRARGLGPGGLRTGPTIPFNRPPRPGAPPPPEPVELPVPPRAEAGPSGVGALSVVASVVGAGVMVAVTGQVLYAALALLGPVTAVATARDGRRRGRRGRRREAARYRRDLDELARTLATRAEAERARRADEGPDPAEILRRVEAPSTRLWERRPGHHDWLRLRAGVGPDPWVPPVAGDPRGRPEEVRAIVEAAGRLVDAPVTVDLSHGGVVGVVGPRPAALAVARALVVQAAVLHGPADLPVLVLAAPGAAGEWDWAKWLPHTRDPAGSGRRLLAADPAGAEDWCRALAEASSAAPHGRATGESPAGPRKPNRDDTGPTTFVLVDDEALTEGRRSPVRAVLRGGAGPVAGVVVAATEDRLPAACTTVVEVQDGDGTARVHRLRDGTVGPDVLAGGISEATARRAARGLARFDDPEQAGGHDLPPTVALLPLLGLDRPDAATMAARWAAGGDDPPLVTPVGVAGDGVLAVDLARDGPHALVAGTTGAGKSELLRSLVAGLAAGASPEHCTFLLVDFKGGSAFDRCAALPHVVGLVTDLDAHLAARALRSLEAELRHRERVLRAAGAADLADLRRRAGGGGPVLSRLVVVVDELATLRAELPDFVESLVGVAQRGRSLGVHLVLATQRPSGAVSENIRANTALRIALRVQDAADSHDVIDGPEAARLPRACPGRAVARFGPGEVVTFQAALSTGPAPLGRGPVEVRPFRGADPPVVLGRADGSGGWDPCDTPSDLDLLVAACTEAHTASGRPLPRRPYLDPLPDQVDLAEVVARAGPAAVFGTPGAEVALALADFPDRQAQGPIGWVPADGHLLLAGLPGSGTTTALLSVALAAARATGPDDLHLYALDMGTGTLAVLEGLPHTGAVVVAGDGERQARLVAWLRAELDRRRAPGRSATAPRVLVLVDGIGALLAEWAEAPGPVLDGFARVFTEGAELGLHLAVTGDRPLALPAPLRSLVRQQWLFRLADDLDHAQAGLRPTDLPAFRPGRAVVADGAVEVQVARPRSGVAAEVAAIAAHHAGPARRRPPATIGALPRTVAVGHLAPAIRLDAVPRLLPIGVGERDLAPAGFTFYDGEHVLVAGPARSGRTTVLAVAGAMARVAGWSTVVVAGPRSPLGRDGALGRRVAPEAVEDLLPLLDRSAGRGPPPPPGPGCGASTLLPPAPSRLTGDPPLLLLVDDAEAVDPEGRVLPDVLARPDVVVVAAGRADALRGLYGHWTRLVRAGRVGVLLQPDVDLDGDLLDVRLPRHCHTPVGPGRGYLCAGGQAELVQVAQLE